MTDLDNAPDELSALIAGIAQSDRDAFRLLYIATSNRLYASALRLVRNRALAEDVLQDTYIRVWRYSKTFNPARARPLTWLTQIMRNRAIDLRTSHGLEVPRETHDVAATSDEPFDDGPQEAGVSFEIRDRTLSKHFEQLDGRSRQVLYLSFTYGLSHAEIAQHMSVPVATAKTSCRRALIELRRRIDEPARPSTSMHDAVRGDEALQPTLHGAER